MHSVNKMKEHFLKKNGGQKIAFGSKFDFGS